MLQASDIKIGIVVAASCSSDISAVVGQLTVALMSAGCAMTNLSFKHIPSRGEYEALGALFMAEYTDVDALVVVSGGDAVPEIAKSIQELQIQWNMPIKYLLHHDGEEDLWSCRDVIDMVILQNDMAAESDDVTPQEKTSSRKNVN